MKVKGTWRNATNLLPELTRMSEVKIIKHLDREQSSDVSLDDVERLQVRYQTAQGHQNSVIKEVFKCLRVTVTRVEGFEKRLRALESR